MDEQVIILVQQHECLYNLQHRDYDNNHLKDKLWKDIAVQLNITAEECKNKWSLLRSYYRRALNRRKTASGQAAKKIKRWRFEMQMEFLKPFLKERETHTNLDEEREEYEGTDGSDDTHNSTQRSTPSPAVSTVSLKRKRATSQISSERTPDLATTLNQFISSRTTTQQVLDPAKRKLMTFFDDISETMLKFNELEQAEIKRDIFNIVNNKELEILRKKQMQGNKDIVGYNFSNMNTANMIHHVSAPGNLAPLNMYDPGTSTPSRMPHEESHYQ